LADPAQRTSLQARFLESQRYAQQDPWAERAAGAEAHEFQPMAVMS
jgi:nitrite reductase (NADH) large subunit